MKKAVVSVLLLLLLSCFSSCAYVNVRTPLDIHLDKTEMGSKKGVATAYSILWLVTFGNAGYAEAAKNGNITVMRHSDQETFSILFGAFTRWRVVVYGD